MRHRVGYLKNVATATAASSYSNSTVEETEHYPWVCLNPTGQTVQNEGRSQTEYYESASSIFPNMAASSLDYFEEQIEDQLSLDSMLETIPPSTFPLQEDEQPIELQWADKIIYSLGYMSLELGPISQSTTEMYPYFTSLYLYQAGLFEQALEMQKQYNSSVSGTLQFPYAANSVLDNSMAAALYPLQNCYEPWMFQGMQMREYSQSASGFDQMYGSGLQGMSQEDSFSYGMANTFGSSELPTSTSAPGLQQTPVSAATCDEPGVNEAAEQTALTTAAAARRTKDNNGVISNYQTRSKTRAARGISFSDSSFVGLNIYVPYLNFHGLNHFAYYMGAEAAARGFKYIHNGCTQSSPLMRAVEMIDSQKLKRALKRLAIDCPGTKTKERNKKPLRSGSLGGKSMQVILKVLGENYTPQFENEFTTTVFPPPDKGVNTSDESNWLDDLEDQE